MFPFLLILLLAALTGFFLTALLIAFMLLQPPRMSDGKALFLLRRLSPADLGLPFQPIAFSVRDLHANQPMNLKAWWIPAANPSGRTVILIHGRADAKVGSIAWAPMLQRLGLNILAVDLRAHGESAGRYSTVGYFERHDIDQLINQLLAQFPDQTQSLILFGLSMGAAVAVATAALRADIAGLILDSAFPSYRQISYCHMERLHFDIPILHRASLAIAQYLSGARFDEVDPARLLPAIACPVLLMDGAADPFLPDGARARLNQTIAARESAGLLTHTFSFPDADHLQAYASNPTLYEATLDTWLQNLQQATSSQQQVATSK